MTTKGIILAGGSGTRLSPMTSAVSKQLLLVYDKPMIYYPLSTLMLAGIDDILIICTKNSLELFKSLLGNGENFGIQIQYKIQDKPYGLAHSFILGEDFIGDSAVTLILGDNLFHGNNFINQIKDVIKLGYPTVFAYKVEDPERYGVVEFSSNGDVISIEEKPNSPKSKFAITGIYYYDNSVINKAKSITPSERGELEITDVNNLYLNDGSLKVQTMGRGISWLDTGTFESMHDASSYVRTIQNRQGYKIGCIEEVAWRNGWIDNSKLIELANSQIKSEYGKYLLKLLKEN